tara:strand:- start:434 stop:1843 length:1410 start_codon:yes stop_codon:yes gene_type:complete
MNTASDMVGEKTHRRARPVTARRLVMFASLALVVLAVLAALVLMQGIDRQIDDMTRTYEVRNQARELTLALTDAEASKLGYVLTGEKRYMEIYSRASAAIETRTASLVSITRNDPLQAERLAAIVSDMAVRVEEMGRAMRLVGAQRTSEARALIQSGASERTMDSVRMALERFIDDENQKLLDRNWSIDGARRWLVGSIIAALAGAAILTYVLIRRTQRDVNVLALNRSLLLSEKEALEAHVRDRTQAVEEARAHAEHERQRVETLLQDTSHRIGNSLATVSSLLGLQLLRSNSAEVKLALEAARSRVHAIASAHRRLRLGDDLETASADEFIDAVLQDLATTVSDAKAVTLIGQIDPIMISARDATTIGILVGELVTNALKHAFPEGRGGNVIVRLKRDEAGVPTLWVIDDGAGIGEQDQPGEGGLGSVIITQLARQFGGTPSYERRPEGGLSVVVPLPGIESTQAAS